MLCCCRGTDLGKRNVSQRGLLAEPASCDLGVATQGDGSLRGDVEVRSDSLSRSARSELERLRHVVNVNVVQRLQPEVGDDDFMTGGQ